MHVLTKIFIVLVALLSVMIVPLVVVYAKNEASYREKYIRADEERAALAQALDSAELSYGTRLEALQGEINNLKDTIITLRNQVQEKNLQLASAESDLATTRAQQTQLNNQVKLLARSVDAAQQLTDQLVKEADQLRTDALAITRRNADLEQEYLESQREREVLDAAVRALREEVQRLSEAEGRAIETIARYEARHGKLDDAGDPWIGGPPITTKITASVIDVRRSEGLMLAEIDVGQRDGVQKGWVLLIGDGNGQYVGRLRIIDVDINRAVGIAETARGEPATTVASGHRVYAFPE